jgi:hypothetical protein
LHRVGHPRERVVQAHRHHGAGGRRRGRPAATGSRRTRQPPAIAYRMDVRASGKPPVVGRSISHRPRYQDA